MVETLSKEAVLCKTLEAFGQEHVWAHYETLKGALRESFFHTLSSLDFEALKKAIDTIQASSEASRDINYLKPPGYIPSPRSGGEADAWERAKSVGESLLRAGKVAALTVAGGQGTRLGLSGPKGCFGVTPIEHKSLFQVFAEKILAAEAYYKTRFFWLIMTSHANNEATLRFFKEHNFFGLSDEQVLFFEQGRFPAVDFNGKLIIAEPGHLAMSPDGHGGTFDALVQSGVLERVCSTGVSTLSYFQVDNPLVNILDPYFIGFHNEHGSSMSSKMVVKKEPEEKVGLFCERQGALEIVEYSDVPQSFTEARDADGRLRFRAGNIAVHLIDCDFAKRIAAQHALPFHRAKKAIPFMNEQGDVERPESPNGIKFEKFIFDGLQFATAPMILEAIREEEFSPVKNAQGSDSPETSMRDQSRYFARWFEQAGDSVPCDKKGDPLCRLEVSPLFANDPETFAKKWESLDPKPSIQKDIYLA